MPVPQQAKAQAGKFRLDSSFSATVRFGEDQRTPAATRRFLQRLDARTGLRMQDRPRAFPGKADLKIEATQRAPLQLHVNESYVLKVSPKGIRLDAATDLGAMHGLQTLLQLLSADSTGWYFPACTIEDAPRFPWRGLLIDVCRHWQPVDVIKRNLDGMAAMKMNVFHWHLSEDQGFRIASKVFPKLHEMGSNGDYFTQEQVRDIVAYADARGIRVVPEFDMPGHATSWFVGHPELASAPGPYEIEKGFGVFDPTMDPTRETTYEFLDAFLTEMCGLFPDAYFHIGGDENEGKQWNANKDIQAFKEKNDLKDNHELQSYFNKRLLKILEKNGKRMVGWDEILQPDIPNNIVIQSWRGKEALIKAASEGYDVMLSNGYYIDLCQPAEGHYLNDPLTAEMGLDAEAQKHVLGGEATMWGELITPETIDSRIWPRTCAIAERFWSPASVRDVKDMYRRLEIISPQLENYGLLHIRNHEMMMRRLCAGQDVTPLHVLIEAVEPLKTYNRHHQGIRYSTDLPFTRIPDIAIPDAPVARRFRESMSAYIASGDPANLLVIRSWMTIWRDNHARYLRLAERAPALREGIPLSEKLKDAAEVGLELLKIRENKEPIISKAKAMEARLEAAAQPAVESEVMIVSAIVDLLNDTRMRR